MADDYTDLVRSLPTEDQIANARIAQPTNPDETAKAHEISKIVAVPPAVVQGDTAFWGEQARVKQARAAIASSPQTMAWLASDPMGALIAGDDLPAMANLASKLPTEPDPDSFFGAISLGWKTTEHHRAVADAAMGIGEPPPPLIPTPLLPVPPPSGAFAHVRDALGNFIGSMSSTVVHAAPPAATGAALGGAIGLATGGPPGAVAGALIGGGRGLGLGIAADMGLTAAGSAYEETGTYRDGDGNSMSEDARKLAALGAGTGTALLATLLPGASKETIAAGSSLIRETVGQAAAKLGKVALKGGLINTGFTAVQSTAEEIAKMSAGDFANVVNDPQARQDFIEKHAESFVDGVLLFGATGAVAKGAGAGYRVLANTGATHLDSLVQAAQDTKLKTRSPDALMEFIRNGTKEDIGISPTADPAALAKIASPEAIQRAQETGADVHIPLSEYIAKVDPATHEALKDDVRFTPDGMTPREAAEAPPEGVSFFITQAQKAQLRERGFSDAQIREMKPAEAHGILREAAAAPPVTGPKATQPVEAPPAGVTPPVRPDVLREAEPAGLPPVKEGFVRFYHGQPPGEGEAPPGPRWVTPDYRYARDFRSTATEPAKVFYIDLPKGHPAEAAMREWTPQDEAEGLNIVGLYHTAELPEDVVAQHGMRPVPAEAVLPPAAAASVLPSPGETPVEAVRRTLYLNPLFAEPLPGMTQVDFARYNRLLEAQAARADETTPPLPEARAEIEAQVDRHRDVSALRELTEREEFRLNPDDVSPRQLPFLPKEVLREGGMHPEDIAPTLGYRSGAEMVRELAKLTREGGREGQIDKAITRLSFGDAINRALNSKQLDVLIAETKALGGPALTREMLRAQVAEQFEKTPINQAAKKDAAMGVVRRQGQLAESALLRNDMAGALVAKQRQAVAFEIARLQRGLEKEVKAYDRLADRYASQKIVANRDEEYTAHIQSLLAALDRPIARQAAELQPSLKGKSLTGFIQEKINDGRIISDPSGLPSHLPFEQWSVEDFRQLKRVIDSLDHNSAKEAFFQAVDKAIGVDTLIKDIQANLADRQFRVDPFNSGGLKSIGRNVDARFLKMERLFDWLDKNKGGIGGPLNQIFRKIKDGQFAEDDMLKEAKAALKAIDDPEVRGGLFNRRFSEPVDNPFMDVDGRPMKLTRGNMIAIATNWGNKSNRDKLTRGYKWDKDAVDDWLMRNMTEADWKFVQGIWDVFAKFWDRADDTVRKMSGIGMDKVEAVPIQTPFGTIRGGYFPVEYDPLRSDITKIKETDLFQRSGAFASLPPAGYTKTRTGVAMPLRLDLAFMGNRLGETIHDIAYREALSDANKVLGDKKVKDAITRAFGPEYTEQIRPWLQYIANRSQTDDRALGWFNDLSREARMNVQTLAIGWNVSTSMVHMLSALSNSVREAGPIHFTRAASEFFRNPTQMKQLWEWADSKSGELRNRKQTMDRDMNELMQKWDANPPAVGFAAMRQRFQLFMMGMIATGDKLSAVPTWIAGYRKGLAEGMSDADAVYLGDKTLRNAHGAGGLPDLAPIMRGPEALRWFTMFMAYFNHNYNQVRDVGRAYAAAYQNLKIGNLRAGSEHFISAVGGTVAYLIVPALIHELIKQGLPTEQQGDTWKAWMARSLEGQVLSMFPVVRDVSNFYIHHHGRGIEVASPLNTLLSTMAKPIEDLAHATGISQGPVSKDWLRHALSAPTAFIGIGLPNQLSRSGQFLWDLHTKRQYANDPMAWYRGLMYGQAHPKPQHHRVH
jgi:hypothetical protein